MWQSSEACSDKMYLLLQLPWLCFKAMVVSMRRENKLSASRISVPTDLNLKATDWNESYCKGCSFHRFRVQQIQNPHDTQAAEVDTFLCSSLESYETVFNSISARKIGFPSLSGSTLQAIAW